MVSVIDKDDKLYSDIDTIEYSTDSDEEVTFDEDDFTEAFEDATCEYLHKGEIHVVIKHLW